MRMFRNLLLSLLALAAMSSAQPPDARKIAEAVDKKYNALQSLQAEFVQIYSGGGRVKRESGTLYLRQPGRMRWDYHEPQQKLLIADGKNAYFYVPAERQARRASLKKLDDIRSPLRFLLGKAKLAKELDQLKLAPEIKPLHPENTVLVGIPTRLADRVDHVAVEVNPQNQIERLIIEEVDGSTTDFQFSAIKENPAVADSQFKFEKPPNVEMVEATDLGD